jgi:hypothetical protein
VSSASRSLVDFTFLLTEKPMSKSALINQIRSLLTPAAPEYPIEFKGRYYEVDDFDYAKMKPQPGAQASTTGGSSECFKLTNGVTVFF